MASPTGIQLSSKPRLAGLSNRRGLVFGLSVILVAAIGVGYGLWSRGQSPLLSQALSDSTPYPSTGNDTADLINQFTPKTKTLTPPSAPPATPAAAGPVEHKVSAAEQARIDAWNEEQKARTTPLSAVNQNSQLAQSYGGPARQNALGPRGVDALTGNLKPPGDTLPYTRTPAAGSYLIAAGTWISATLEPQANSDLAGTITARITEPIYDTRDGRRDLLIPQNARVIGTYDNRLGFAQSRLMQFWNRIMFEDGSSLRIDGMEGEDINGAAGAKDHVNYHFARLLTDAALVSGFAAGIGLTQRTGYSTFGYPSVGSEISQQVGAQLSTLGSQLISHDFNRPPTIEIRSGYKFFILVLRDIVFAAPYEPWPSMGTPEQIRSQIEHATEQSNAAQTLPRTK